ncbi:AMP-binding protein [Streptomyces pinistramenti]|uniref:AMP-binding protein n=1 Tax=Streptomyces pinistramenti TaxID=2884812 RepID=UPI001D077D97|nr:AMP-binding protein [Streptomyces pinistramenti]MCB5910035.1 AMP-binding protein [Streptomyces pinistramenti]
MAWTTTPNLERANRLARLLLSRGAGPEERVGVMTERSADLVAALLAVVKTGAAYVPIDPAHPAASPTCSTTRIPPSSSPPARQSLYCRKASRGWPLMARCATGTWVEQ